MNIKQFAGINSLYKKPNGEAMSHEELYTKVVNGIGLETCERFIPAPINELHDALKKDPHLNNIPIKKWDDMHGVFHHVFSRIGVRVLSLSDTVCTLKQAARMLVARNYPESNDRSRESEEVSI